MLRENIQAEQSKILKRSEIPDGSKTTCDSPNNF